MNENVFQHFRPSEKTFIEIAQGQIRQVLDEYRPVLTKFLNPRERFILETLVNSYDELKLLHNGGNASAEMARGLIYPSYYEPTVADFELAAIEISYPAKFAELHHSTIMGALIHNGLERDAFGDVIGTDDGHWQFVSTTAMVSYIETTMDHIGKTKVRFIPIDLSDLQTAQDDWETLEMTVSSLRLDNIVANGYNVSRAHAKELVERGQVRVNWTTVDRPDYSLAINDMISVRKFGRIKIVAENGLTKKEKWRVTLSVIKK
ncbi:RNA-binding protein [Weissella muntiaci]|uniref:RNA-binding protein n=1 Tax=Weissella muntiaci TaxID=2508881 RepID=A0A6C2C9N0_9LACO|nr:RNA-binding protein [Weissella muntiaci]TYC50123.1 RNA-binding protein [Weissella muntiaci]